MKPENRQQKGWVRRNPTTEKLLLSGVTRKPPAREKDRKNAGSPETSLHRKTENENRKQGKSIK